jgi:hypothetical protein
VLVIALVVVAAVLVIYATVVWVWNRSPRRWARVAAVAGVSVLVVGIVLYLVVVLISLSRYEGVDDPSWVNVLAVLALVLAGSGLLAIISAAVGAARRTPRHG